VVRLPGFSRRVAEPQSTRKHGFGTGQAFQPANRGHELAQNKTWGRLSSLPTGSRAGAEQSVGQAFQPANRVSG
jgi:hypothetical protein